MRVKFLFLRWPLVLKREDGESENGRGQVDLKKLNRGGVITPPEVTNTGPGFNRGSGGGARGCGFEEWAGAHARTEGGGVIFYSRRCLRVCLSACLSPLRWQFRSAESPTIKKI